MLQLASLFAPVGLFLAAAGASGLGVDIADVAKDNVLTVTGWPPSPSTHQPQSARQARMEGRIILRISPRPMPPRSEFFDIPEDEPVRVVERQGPRCVPVRDITGTADQGRRLILFLRNERVLIADLAKGCSARDFYRGFYLERSEDGRMCSGRDVLMARSGAKCELAGMRELVVVR